MHYWRGKIGRIGPAADFAVFPEYAAVLPEGVGMTVTTTAVETVAPEDFQKAFDMYLPAAKRLAVQKCDVIIAAGSALFTYMGYDKSREMIQNIRETISIPVVMNLEADFDALKALSAKKIVIASPYDEARNQERKNLCESLGFEVVNMKGLGIKRRGEIGDQPPYASYRLAKQAFLEAPEADAIYISCPEWPTVRNIEKLEHDLGKPVVATVTAEIWAALRAMHVREIIRGYGKLLELI